MEKQLKSRFLKWTVRSELIALKNVFYIKLTKRVFLTLKRLKNSLNRQEPDKKNNLRGRYIKSSMILCFLTFNWILTYRSDYKVAEFSGKIVAVATPFTHCFLYILLIIVVLNQLPREVLARTLSIFSLLIQVHCILDFLCKVLTKLFRFTR